MMSQTCMQYEIITLVVIALTIVSEILPFCRNVPCNGIIHYLIEKIRNIRNIPYTTPHEQGYV